MQRFIATVLALAVCVAPAGAAAKKKDTPAAAKTRKKLKEKISVDYKDTRLADIAKDIGRQFDNRLSIKLDNVGGVSNNLTLTYSAKDKPLDEILDEMFAKNQLGYVVVSRPNDRLDGWIVIKKGKQRGYEAGEEPAAKEEKPEPAKTAKDGDKKDKAARDGEKPAKDGEKKEKPVKTKPKASKDKAAKDGDKGEEDGDKEELTAAAKLKLATMLEKDGLTKKARQRYQDIIKSFPKTKAAEEARKRLKGLEK